MRGDEIMEGEHIELLDLMALADERDASDVHLAPGRKPALRIDGEMGVLDQYPVITPDESERLLYSILRDDQRLALDENWETDLSYALNLGRHNVRFRINMHRQYRGLAAVFRLIPDRILTPEEICLEDSILDLTEAPRGLVLVTGPTGSGKSTTLATMIDQINQREKKHILTVEDPIEFVHPEKRCVVTQRELGVHTKSFENALRSGLREDPDIILVGEMRDLETIALALTAAETGHLVFATLHTTDAAQTVDRMVDVFPSGQQQMVRTQLGSVLKAIVCQVLLRRSDKEGRVAGREILLATPAVRSLIRENQSQKIYASMETGIRDGMCPLELSLAQKVKQGVLNAEDASTVANNQKALREYIKGNMPMMGGGNNKTSEARSNSLDSGGNKGKKSFFSR
jgi:twitching motility protein PilT